VTSLLLPFEKICLLTRIPCHPRLTHYSLMIKIIPIPSEALLPTADKPMNAITKKTQELGVDKFNEGIFCSSLIVKMVSLIKVSKCLKRGSSVGDKSGE